MNKYGMIVFLLLAFGSSHAQIYKWTDSNGIVHFSDTPHPGAKKFELPGGILNTPPASEALPTDVPSASKIENDNGRLYTHLAVSEPKNEATIRNNQGYVPVIVEITPELKQGDLLQILYDGETLGKPQAGLIFALNNVKRGTHTIAVQALDKDGNVLNTSEEITFFMQRPRVGMVPGTRPN